LSLFTGDKISNQVDFGSDKDNLSSGTILLNLIVPLTDGVHK
jgi:hypothetical protein